MLELVIFGIFALVFFIAGVLVANNNKDKTSKIVNELKEKLDNLENKAKGE